MPTAGHPPTRPLVLKPSPRRGLLLGPALVLLLALPGCDLFTGPDSRASHAVIEVDPQVVRTVHYHAPSARTGEVEETTLLMDEIACLHTTPRECILSEAIRVTVHNQGLTRLEFPGRLECHQPLERFALGVWNATTSRLCTLIGGAPIQIAPGRSVQVDVGARGMVPALYRVRIPLRDMDGPLPEDQRTSEPFELQPLPDFTPFVCPTEDRSGQAAQIAREQIELAVAGSNTRGIESEFLRIEHEVPGFGGFYFDPDLPGIVAWLTPEAREAGADTIIHRLVNPNARIQTGEFSFSELVGWSFVLSGPWSMIPGAVSLDADEKRNRVTVRAASLLAATKLECVGEGIGMPEGMLNVWRPGGG